MAKYVDGFVIPISKDKIEEYRRIAEKASAIWKEHGALEYSECIGDDLDVKDQIPFPSAAKAEPGETVVFAWIVYESREHRDRVNAAVINDPRIAKMMAPGSQPFDCKRMVYGGFKILVEA
jgi:uncharacterized protein YbaA (DUF1428 family)